jgi:two-component sensor histidine kinase
VTLREPWHQGAGLDHVLVLAPYRKDGEYLGRLLREHDIAVSIGTGAEKPEALFATDPGVLVATHEALSPGILAAVADYLVGQPKWSEMPILVLLDRASRPDQVRSELGRAWPRSRQVFYQRPVTAVELISGVQSALLARWRQRDVRDHIIREMELRRELNHRVKNILASVTSIFEMTRRGATGLDTFAEDFRGRLQALEKVHSAVFHAGAGVVLIDEVAALTFEPYRLADHERIRTDGPEVGLQGEAGTTLALCLHELATNAIKYGSLSEPEGQVWLRWTVSSGSEPELAISWKETGGPQVVEPTRQGYGTRYVRTALAALFGQPPTMLFEADGLRCEVSGPLLRLQGNL